MEAKPEYIVQGDFRQGRAYECTKELLGLPDPPDAIFTANNMTTLGCLRYLTERGLRPGIDMELLSFDPIDALNAIGYKLPYIGRDVGAIGEAAMKLLIRKLRKDRPARGRLATEKMVLPCRLVTD
jgi:LacI family transcriptional regulator